MKVSELLEAFDSFTNNVFLAALAVYVALLAHYLIVRWLGRRNPNGSCIRGCTCCGCYDGCDARCAEMEDNCRIYGVKLPEARCLRGKHRRWP